MSLVIKNHLVEGVRQVPTKKYTHGRVIQPVGIVYHYTCGWTTAGDVNQLSQASAAVSAHFVVGRDGEIVQIVPCNRRAWHAGPSKYGDMQDLNNQFIGIEISNIGWLRKRPDMRYEDYHGNIINPDGSFLNNKRNAHSAPKNWLETKKYPRLGSGVYVWEPYYDPQLAALDALTKAICEEYPIRFGVSHEEIDKRGWKTDPGPAFPMERYKQIIKTGEVPAPPKTPPHKVDVAVAKEGFGTKIKKWMQWPL